MKSSIETQSDVPVAAQPSPWWLAVDTALLDAGLDCTAGEQDDAQACVRRLIEWTLTVALDPAVSAEAQALIDRGRAQAAQPAEPMTKVDRFLAMVRVWVERDGGDMDAALAWMHGAAPRKPMTDAEPVAEAQKVLDEFAEFVTTHNKEKPVPWPIAELFIRKMRAVTGRDLETV